MSNVRERVIAALLVGFVSSCGDAGGETQTCVVIVITYTGSKSGVAYLRVNESDGGAIALNAPSIQDLISVESGNSRHCFGGSGRPDPLPFTASAWIDVSGAGAANCTDLTNPLCQPSPTDPQAHQSGVERRGQTTRIQLDVLDPP